MKRFLLAAILIAVAPTAALAAPVLTIQGETLNIAGAGQFQGSLNPNLSTYPTVFYCVDFINPADLSPAGYAINISTAGNLSDTRYGTTAQSSFSYQTAPDGASLGSAAQRYGEAAWLISQYDLTPGANLQAKDIGIQNAIWDLLNATGHQNTQGDWQTWLNAAAASGGVSNYVVYTPLAVAGESGTSRYTGGGQEMIGLLLPAPAPVVSLASIPEPQSLVLVVLGGLLIAAGLRGRGSLDRLPKR